MDILNEMKVDFLSKSCNEFFARVTAAAFISQLDPTVEELADIKTAVSEAVTNSIVHGYQNSHGVITMIIRILGVSTAEITIIDNGKGIDDVDKARQPLYTTATSEERSGMGFTVMETFMDKLEVFSTPGEGTKVVMIKDFKSVC